jgi:hypothetical protein
LRGDCRAIAVRRGYLPPLVKFYRDGIDERVAHDNGVAAVVKINVTDLTRIVQDAVLI